MAANLLFDILDIVASFDGQVFILAHAGNIAAPAGHGGHDGLCLVDDGREREVVGLFAVNLILLADGDLLHVGKNVELRQGNLGRALDLAAVAGRNDVDGANSAGTTGGCAIFRACFAQLLGFLTEPFGRERAFADAGGVCLHDTDRAVNMASRNASADARVARVGGGRGRVGEDAEVNVAERAQLRLKHDVLARGLRVIHVLRRVADIGRKLLAELLAPGKHVGKLIGLGTIDVLDREVFPLENGGKALLEILRI